MSFYDEAIASGGRLLTTSEIRKVIAKKAGLSLYDETFFKSNIIPITGIDNQWVATGDPTNMKWVQFGDDASFYHG